jgi:hypothetical protein
MLEDLLALEREHDDVRASLVVVSRGTPEVNRAQGMEAQTLLERQAFELGRALGAPGTPSAVVIDGEGRIASGVAVGAEAVLELARGQVAAS